MTALATCASISYVLTEQMIFLIIGLLWLTFLVFLKRLNILSFIISLAALIFFSYYIPTLSDPKLEQIDEQHIQLTGKVVQPLEQTLKKLQFTVRDSKADEKYLVLYFPQEDEYISESSKQSIKYGATCTLKGTVNLPERARNPGQFDFFNYYVERGLTVQIIIDTLEQIDCKGSSIFHPLFKLREFLLHEVQQSMSEMTAPWIQALVLGERGNLDERTIDIFQRWGLSHLLAISGLHVGIIIASLYFIIVRCGILTKESAEWVLIIFLPIYSIIAGGEPSVLRSSLMVLIFLIINKVRLSFHLQDTISVVFLILIIVNPLFVYHIGFQFSFLVTFALILSRQWLQQTTSPLWQLLIICYVSQMAILPLQFHYFHTFQPLSIFVNFIIVPYFSLFVIPFMFFLVPLFLMAPIVA